MNEIAELDKDKAFMFKNFFSSCFNLDVPPLTPTSESLDDAVLNNTYIDDILCTSEEVISYIMLLDVKFNKASGPDGISSKMFKATAHSIAPSNFLISPFD